VVLFQVVGSIFNELKEFDYSWELLKNLVFLGMITCFFVWNL